MSGDLAPVNARRGGRLRAHPVLAGLLGVVALLLFCWPFVGEPRPSVPDAFRHVFVSWAASIALLWWMSRDRGRTPDPRGRDRDA